MSTWTLMSSVAIRWKRARSSSGSTSWSAMTSNGNGKVSSRTRSARPSPMKPSMRECTTGPMTSFSQRSMALRVNACWMRPR